MATTSACARSVATRQAALRYVRYLDDFPVDPTDNIWDDTRSRSRHDDKIYVVQTQPKVIERCLLMTTDPGDLVLDPTCGRGTTAYVAEQWGRRWITSDTSRVALALARTRLMAARYPYYLLADSPEGHARRKPSSPARCRPTYKTDGDIRKGFVYKRVPHVTLKSIANNPDIKEGMTRQEIDAAIPRHADTETALRPALRGQQARPRHRPVHGREPVAAPRAVQPTTSVRAASSDGAARRRGGPLRDDDPRQPAQGRRAEHASRTSG